jgi:hypothetical protein
LIVANRPILPVLYMPCCTSRPVEPLYPTQAQLIDKYASLLVLDSVSPPHFFENREQKRIELGEKGANLTTE